MYHEGKARAIGVSNYTALHLQQLLDNAAVKPMVNQVREPPGGACKPGPVPIGECRLVSAVSLVVVCFWLPVKCDMYLTTT